MTFEIEALAPALLMGVFGGAHCVVMCGGVAGLLAGASRRRLYAVAYNFGRILAYATLGGAMGGLSSLADAAWLDALRYGLRGLAALLMLAVGLHLLGLPSFVRAVEAAGAPLFRRIAPVARRILPLRKVHHALAAGMLWGMMPCGLLYGALALATSTASPARGAMTMIAFGLGTLPLMLTVSALASTFARARGLAVVRRLAGGIVLGFGLYALGGTAGQVELGTLGPGADHAAHACCPRVR